MSPRSFPFHEETGSAVAAPMEAVFAHLDDPLALSAHMAKRSMMMMGSRMSTVVDEGRGQGVGSKIRMEGRVMGLSIWLDEVVTERQPPRRKSWETVGQPRLLVIAGYRMGFEIEPLGMSSHVRVFIDYELPMNAPQSWLGRLFGRAYARWCVARMASDAAQFKGQSVAGSAG